MLGRKKARAPWARFRGSHLFGIDLPQGGTAWQLNAALTSWEVESRIQPAAAAAQGRCGGIRCRLFPNETTRHPLWALRFDTTTPSGKVTVSGVWDWGVWAVGWPLCLHQGPSFLVVKSQLYTTTTTLGVSPGHTACRRAKHYVREGNSE